MGWCVLEGMWRRFHYGGYGWWLERIIFVVCIVIMCDDDDNVGVVWITLLCDSCPLDDFWDEIDVGNVGISMAIPSCVECMA